MSVSGSASPPRPSPLPGSNRPPLPPQAVMYRKHPPLYAGDYNNNLAKGMYWWEKLDPSDPEDERAFFAMCYGEQRQPRCNLCERQDRACMSFLGEDDQPNKSCVKCRRQHAPCRPFEKDDDLQLGTASRESSLQQRTSSSKRKASGLDTNDKSSQFSRCTRSSLRPRQARESAGDPIEMIRSAWTSLNNQHAASPDIRSQPRLGSSLDIGGSWVDPELKLDEETPVNHTEQPSAARCRDDRSSSGIIVNSQVKDGIMFPQDNTSSDVVQKLYAFVDAFKSDYVRKSQKRRKDDDLEDKVLRLEKENDALVNRMLELDGAIDDIKGKMLRSEAGWEAEMKSLRSEMRQAKERREL